MIMNLYILFCISLPEAFLNGIIILLFAGAKEKLKPTKINILKFITFIALSLALTSLVRPLARNVIENILISSVVYIFIIAIIFRLKLIHAALSVLFTILLFSTVENSYYPFIVAYISKGMENYMQHYHWIVLYALPTRIFQMIVIAFLYKYDILLVTKIDRKFHKICIFSSFILIFVEYFFAFIFSIYFNMLPLLQQILFAGAIVLMVIAFNYLLFKTIYVTIGKIITNGFSQYQELEDNARLAFNLIHNLLKNNNQDEAIELIERLNAKEG